MLVGEGVSFDMVVGVIEVDVSIVGAAAVGDLDEIVVRQRCGTLENRPADRNVDMPGEEPDHVDRRARGLAELGKLQPSGVGDEAADHLAEQGDLLVVIVLGAGDKQIGDPAQSRAAPGFCRLGKRRIEFGQQALGGQRHSLILTAYRERVPNAGAGPPPLRAKRAAGKPGDRPCARDRRSRKSH